MRISDWSSDVCSSDLAGPHGRPVARPGAADLGAARGLGKTIQKEFWLMDETVAARIKQEIDDNQVVLFMKGTPVFPQCGFSAAVVQRSEEHTSELQSLMRISYAVFCLKKKNDKHKYSKNTY